MAREKRLVGLAGAVALCAALALAPGMATGAKKPKLKPFAATTTVNAAIPNWVAAARSVPVLSTITVPKRYKGTGVGDQSIGPWTIDDDSPVSICNVALPGVCASPDLTLARPFAGTSNSIYNFAGNFPMNGRLSIFDGVTMRGTWTLLIADLTAGATSVLDGWGLKITPAKPVKG